MRCQAAPKQPADHAAPPAEPTGVTRHSNGAGPSEEAQDTQVAADQTATAAPRPAAQGWKWDTSDDALRAYGALLAVLAAGGLPGYPALSRYADLPYFVGLACATIYIGAHRGLTASQRQQINLKQGALAPLAASAALGGAYLLIKFLPGLSLQTFLNAYFWLVGTFAVTGALYQPLRRIGGPLGRLQQVPIPAGLATDEVTGEPVTSMPAAWTDLAALAAGVGLASADLACGHSSHTLNNMLATLIASDILQLLGLRSFRAGAVMLAGLLAYDVFWVFASPQVVGDNVMLAVATSDQIVGPTRLLFPRTPGGVGEAASYPFSLLGLGDVAVPGLLACLALRYDASRAVDMRTRAAAAAGAIRDVFSDMEPGASGRQMALAAAEAADAAYDEVADRELAHWQQPGEPASSSSSSSNGSAGSEDGSSSNGSGPASSSAGGNSSAGSQESTSGRSAQGIAYLVSDAVLHQRTYFIPTMVAYVAGLGVAFGANAVTHLGQPALLYLVPATLGAVALTAARRRELAQVWQFTDVPSSLPPAKQPKDAS